MQKHPDIYFKGLKDKLDEMSKQAQLGTLVGYMTPGVGEGLMARDLVDSAGNLWKDKAEPWPAVGSSLALGGTGLMLFNQLFNRSSALGGIMKGVGGLALNGIAKGPGWRNIARGLGHAFDKPGEWMNKLQQFIFHHTGNKLLGKYPSLGSYDKLINPPGDHKFFSVPNMKSLGVNMGVPVGLMIGGGVINATHNAPSMREYQDAPMQQQPVQRDVLANSARSLGSSLLNEYGDSILPQFRGLYNQFGNS